MPWLEWRRSECFSTWAEACLLVSVGTWFQVGWVGPQALIPAATLKEYIAFARARCQPELSPDAATDLIQGYCDMRRMGTSRKAKPPPLALLLCELVSWPATSACRAAPS